MNARYNDNKALQVASGEVATSGDNELIAAPGVDHKILIHRYEWRNTTTTSTDVVLTTDEDTPPEFDRFTSAAVGGGRNVSLPDGYVLPLTNNAALVLNLSGAVAHEYYVLYEVVDDRYNRF